MFDFLCQDQVLQAVPWLAAFLGWFFVLALVTRTLAEILFVIARICGRRTSGFAKFIGECAWNLGRLLGALAWSTPRGYLRAKFVPRPPKEK